MGQKFGGCLQREIRKSIASIRPEDTLMQPYQRSELLISNSVPTPEPARTSLPVPQIRHRLGTLCAFAAGAWLGAAEAPAALVASGFRPFAISFCMVLWSFPRPMDFAGRDERYRVGFCATAPAAAFNFVGDSRGSALVRGQYPHYLRHSRCRPRHRLSPVEHEYARRHLFGMALFHELRGASAGSWAKCWGGAGAIVLGSVLLSAISIHTFAGTPGRA